MFDNNNVLCISIMVFFFLVSCYSGLEEKLCICFQHIRARMASHSIRQQTINFVYCQKGSKYSTLNRLSSELFPHVLDPILKISQLSGAFIIMMAQLVAQVLNMKRLANIGRLGATLVAVLIKCY